MEPKQPEVLPVDLGEPDEFEFLFNPVTMIVHLARPCQPDHPACQFRPTVEDDSGAVALRPGCSIRGNLAIGALQRMSSIPQGARLCLKHGCGKDPAVASLLAALTHAHHSGTLNLLPNALLIFLTSEP